MSEQKEKLVKTERKKHKALTPWQIVWVGIGSLLVLLTPLWIYMGYLAKNGISGKPEHWGQFGDFFGGVLNPIIALLTLAATIIIAIMLKRIDDRNRKKDRAINFMPDLFLDQPGFYTYKQQQFGAEKPVEYSLNSKGFMYRSSLQVPNTFGIKVYNIGLGSAKNVQMTFEIDTTQIAGLINQQQHAMPAERRITVTHEGTAVAGLVRFEYPAAWNTGPFQLIEILNDVKRTSRILPESDSNAFHYLEFPQYFLELYSCYLYVWNWWLQNNAGQRPGFIPIYLKIKYQDIANNAITKKIKIELTALTGGNPEFTNAVLVEEVETIMENEN